MKKGASIAQTTCFATTRSAKVAWWHRSGSQSSPCTKKLNRDLDMQKADHPLSPGCPERRTAQPLINIFFMELYHSACEALPEHQHTEGVDGQIMQETEDPQAVGIPPKDIEEIFTWTPEAALSECTVHFLSPNASAPMQHLPPGKPVTLFWQFLAWCEAMQSPGSACGPRGEVLEHPTIMVFLLVCMD